MQHIISVMPCLTLILILLYLLVSPILTVILQLVA